VPESNSTRSTTRQPSSRFLSWSPLLVAILAALMQWPFFDRGLSVMDEGHILMFSDIVANGGELYRDATLLPLPGAFYLLSLAFEIFGPSILVARWIALIEFALLCSISFAVVRRLASPSFAWGGVIAMFVYRVWVFPHWHMYSYSTMSLLLLACGLFAMLRYLESANIRWLAAAGTAGGLAVLCKQDYGVAGLIAMNAVLIAERFSLPRAQREGTFRRAIGYNAPAVAIGAMTALHFLRQGLFGEMLQQTLLNHLIGIASFEYSSLPPIFPLFEQNELLRGAYGIGAYVPGILFMVDWNRLTASAFYNDTFLWDIAIKLFFYAPYAIVAFGGARLWMLRARFRDTDSRRAALQELALYALAGMLIAILNKPVDFVHVAVLYWPLLWLFVVYAHALVAGRARLAWGLGAIAVVPALLLVAYSAWMMAELTAKNSAPLRGERAGVWVLPNEAMVIGETVDYIKARTSPDQPVAVLPYFPLVSFLADRRAPHRATYTLWPIEYIPNRQQQIIAAIEASDTRHMIYHFTQFAQFPRMGEFAPELFSYLVDAWRIDRVMSDPGWGMMVAGLERIGEPEGGQAIVASDGSNVTLEIELADGRRQPVPDDRRNEVLVLSEWPFRPAAALRPLTGGRRSVMSMPLLVPTHGRLETAVSVHPDRWFKFPPAHVTFEIWVVAAGERSLLATRTINPQGNSSDRRWFDIVVPLETWAGRQIQLEFTTATDRSHAEVPEMAGWAIPRLVSEP
jgi:hypothetical protein